MAASKKNYFPLFNHEPCCLLILSINSSLIFFFLNLRSRSFQFEMKLYSSVNSFQKNYNKLRFYFYTNSQYLCRIQNCAPDSVCHIWFIDIVHLITLWSSTIIMRSPYTPFPTVNWPCLTITEYIPTVQIFNERQTCRHYLTCRRQAFNKINKIGK